MQTKIENQLDEITRELRAGCTGANIHRVANLLQVVSATMQGVRVHQLLEVMPQVAQVYGEFMKALADAMSDGKIDDTECCALNRLTAHVLDIMKLPSKLCREARGCPDCPHHKTCG